MPGLIGLDTATPDTAVAARNARGLVWETAVPPRGGSARPVHATALPGLLERAADELGGWANVGRLAVGVGPGSFTGLRIGVATARGFAQALGLEVAAVSTIDALAAGIGEIPGAQGRSRLAVLDARRGEVYAALYGPSGAAVWAVELHAPEALGERVSALDAPPLAGGDGSLRFRAILEASGATVLHAADPANRIAARHICGLGMTADPVAVTELEPIYIRPPDAELWREQQKRRHDGT